MILLGTKGEEILIDNEDFDKVKDFKWNGCGKYPAQYIHISKTRKKAYIPLHKIILDCPDDMLVDHINGNPYDNRKCNLRLATRSQNNQNRRSSKNSTSKYLGVCWHKKDNKWQVAIRVNGKGIHLGQFKDEIEAAKIYNIAALKYHGEFARINIFT